MQRYKEHRLDIYARPHKVYEYYVTGTGEFPWDMLRYDSAWPADSSDAAKLGVGYWGNDDDCIRVRSIKMRSYRQPTINRWSSFTWSVGIESLETAS